MLDGRDIGTVIAPEAEVKLFVTASVGARALRRFLEMELAGRSVDLSVIEEDLVRRDARDSGRTTAPLRQADDAILLDNSQLGRDEAVAAALAAVEARQI